MWKLGREMRSVEYIEIFPEETPYIVQCIEIEKEAFGNGAIDEWVIKPMARYGKIYGVIEKANVLGIVEMLKTWGKNEVYIFSFAVREKFRKRGIGKYMLEKTLKMLEWEEVEKVVLTVSPANETAVKMYMDFGFVVEKLLENEYGSGEHRLYMSKSL